MSMNQDNSEFSYVQPYSTNSGRSDSFMDKMKMKNMMRSNYQDDYDMSEFFKSMRSSDMMDNYRMKLQEERPHVAVQADVQLLPLKEAGIKEASTAIKED